MAFTIIQAISTVTLLTFGPKVRTVGAIIVCAIDTVSLVIKSLPLSTRAVWDTTAITVSDVATLAIVAKCPKLGASIAIIVCTFDAVSRVVPSLATPTLLVLILDTLMSIAGSGIPVVALLAFPFRYFSFLVRWFRRCTAGNDVPVVLAWHCPRVPGGGQETDQSHEEESAESVHGDCRCLHMYKNISLEI